jgi:hypothetical protein
MPSVIRRLAVVAVVLAATTACAANEPDATAGVDPALLRADIDTEAGAIALPLQRFALTDREQGELFAAQGAAFAQCAAQEGVSWTPADPSAFDLGASRKYGVWFRPEAERFGYGLPNEVATAGDQADAGATAPEPTAAELAVYEECNASDEVQQFESTTVRPGFDYAEETTGLSEASLNSENAQAVFEDWEACLAESGVHVQRDGAQSPWTIEGTTTDVTESNIRIALIDVTCKEDTNYVQRLADIEATLQAPIVEEHLAELQQMRTEFDEMLDSARQFLAENG